jgi:hypothetical protein
MGNGGEDNIAALCCLFGVKRLEVKRINAF